ncbi:MAG TPA: flagellar basal body-associated FliL family protein [Acidobacteriota bacterium]|nr:flagellar basal body-associated FliL family protein [Acidobacteriota bacterium]
MPADDEKTTVVAGEEAASDASSPGSRKKLVLYGGIAAVCLVLGVALAVFVVRPMVAGSGGGAAEQAAGLEQPREDRESKQAERHKAEPKERTKASGDEGKSVVYAIRDIVVNPAGTGGSRFLSVSFGFEVASEQLVAELESREPVIRDALITILCSKTVAELTDAKQKEITRYQIKKRVEQLLQTDELAGVYYTDFVLQ